MASEFTAISQSIAIGNIGKGHLDVPPVSEQHRYPSSRIALLQVTTRRSTRRESKHRTKRAGSQVTKSTYECQTSQRLNTVLQPSQHLGAPSTSPSNGQTACLNPRLLSALPVAPGIPCSAGPTTAPPDIGDIQHPLGGNRRA